MPSGSRAGFKTAWTDAGSGDRKALLIHCSLAHHNVWEGVMAGLANAYSMTAFDMPGHGAADDWDNDAGHGDYQLRTAEIAATFCDGPTHIIGHSFGATVALRFAVERPELVSGLTLIEPVFFAIARHDGAKSYNDHVKGFEPFAQAMQQGDREGAAQIFTEMWGAGVPWRLLPPQARRYIVDRIHLIPAGADAIETDRDGVVPKLGQVDCPVTLIEGGNSPAIVDTIQSGLQKRLKNCTRHVIDGAGHMVPISHPNDVAAIIRAEA